MSFNFSDFIEFLNKTTCPQLSVDFLSYALDEAEAECITLSDLGKGLSTGKIYYILSNEAFLCAIKPGTSKGALKIAAAHTDFPVLKVKNLYASKGFNIEKANVELYGGAIHHTFMDRPLKLSGRIYFELCGETDYIDIEDFGARFIIPNAAIHMNREINNGAKFSIQNNMLPFLGLTEDGNDEPLKRLVCDSLPENAELLSYDLSFTDAEPASLLGINEDLISSCGLDDRSLVYTAFKGFLDADNTSPDTKCFFALNNEECGSESVSGARSAIISEIIKKLCESIYPEENYIDVCSRSVAVSADMAHATHPSFASFSDSTSPVELGKGIVLKSSSNQSYATGALAQSGFLKLCRNNDIAFQRFTNNSDARGGSTIGPMIAASLCIPTVDIGIPMLAMHSARETAAIADHETAYEFFKCFYK